MESQQQKYQHPASCLPSISCTTVATLTVYPGRISTEEPKKKKRLSYTPEQVEECERVFIRNQYPTRRMMLELSENVGVPVDKLRTWFQNRRSRLKKAVLKGKASKLGSGATDQTVVKPIIFGTYPLNTTCNRNEATGLYPDRSGLINGLLTPAVNNTRHVTRWLQDAFPSHTTPATITNQAYMDSDSHAVYSPFYQQPVMSPLVTTNHRPEFSKSFVSMATNYQASKYFEDSSYLARDSLAQSSTHMGSSFDSTGHRPTNHPRSQQLNINCTSCIQENSHKVQRGTCSTFGHQPDDTINNNFCLPTYREKCNSLYNMLLNVGQLQFSSYCMTSHTQSIGNNASMHFGEGRQINAGNKSSGIDSITDLPLRCRSRDSIHDIGSNSCQSASSLKHGASFYPWRYSPKQDVMIRSLNVNKILVGSSSRAKSPSLTAEVSLGKYISSMSNSSPRFNNGVGQNLRYGNPTNMNYLQMPRDYIGHLAGFTDDDSWSTRNSQDSDSESLESFGSIPCVKQLDMLSSFISDTGHYGQMPQERHGDF